MAAMRSVVSLAAFVVLGCIAAGVRLGAQEATTLPLDWLGPHETGDELPVQKEFGGAKFPDELLKTTQIGWAEIDSYVDERGVVSIGEVAASLPLFEEAARAAYAGMKIEPARRNGKPVASRVQQVFLFNPASAAADGADATPRLLRAGVIVDPARKVASEVSRPEPEVVWVSVGIGADGSVGEVLAPTARLTGLIQAGLRGWWFAPARSGGVPKEATLRLPVLLIAPGGLAENLIVPAQVITATPPIYPYRAAVGLVQGAALITFVVEKDGSTSDVTIRRASHFAFGLAAREAVQKWKFAPARKDGVPVRTRMMVPILFRIENENASSPEDAGKGVTVKEKGDPSKLPEAIQFDIPPKVWRLEQPKYPYALLAKSVKGTAQVAIVIGPDGKVAASKVVQADSPEFGYALQAAVEQNRYEPAIKNGDPTLTMIRVEEKFEPKSAGENLIVSDDERSALRMELKQPRKIAKATELDGALTPVYTPSPAYPRSLAEPIEGEAVVDFLVNEKGNPVLLRVVSASRPEFGYAAVQGISDWRFEEPTRGGTPVTVRVRVPVKFQPPAGYPNEQRISVP